MQDMETPLKDNIDTNTWEGLASDRMERMKLNVVGVIEFENSRIAYAGLKRAGKNMKNVYILNKKGATNVAVFAFQGQASLPRNGVIERPMSTIETSSLISLAA